MTLDPCPRWLVVGTALLPWIAAIVALVLIFASCEAPQIFQHGGIIMLKNGERVACSRISTNEFDVRCDQDDGFTVFKNSDIRTTKIFTIDRAARP